MKKIRMTAVCFLATLGAYSQAFDKIQIRNVDMLGLLTLGFISGVLYTQIIAFYKNKS